MQRLCHIYYLQGYIVCSLADLEIWFCRLCRLRSDQVPSKFDLSAAWEGTLGRIARKEEHLGGTNLGRALSPVNNPAHSQHRPLFSASSPLKLLILWSLHHGRFRTSSGKWTVDLIPWSHHLNPFSTALMDLHAWLGCTQSRPDCMLTNYWKIH